MVHDVHEVSAPSVVFGVTEVLVSDIEVSRDYCVWMSLDDFCD